MNIFVGNLAFDATQDDIKKLFEGFGKLASAVIVMSKEKKTPKSRGFGFVEMPDEEQALAAIAALNEKEFMGRILNISQARPKTEADRQSELKMKMQLKALAKAELLLRKEQEQKKVLADPVLNQHLALKVPRPNGRAGTPPSAVDVLGKPGTYRGGRRTRSYIKQHSLDGIQEEVKPWRKARDNPMRWRKKKNQSRPWRKGPGEHKPWEKAEGEARPRSKSSGESKPWRKPESRLKPWEKPEGESKPWKKHGGGFGPHDKARGEFKPWKKTAGEAKPWSKGSERPQGSRFNPSTSSFDKLRTNPERVKRVEGSLGMVRGDGKRSLTKGRKKPGGFKR